MTHDDLLQLIDQVFEKGWTKLNLSEQNLSELPPEIGKLNQLEVLILGYGDDYFSASGNRIKKLPSEIVHLIHLKKLYLIGNQLSFVLPEIIQMTQLQHLDFSLNPLSTLPPEIGQLAQLKILKLNSTQLRVLPPELFQLTQLEELDISHNPLGEIPPEIGQLAQLKKLKLNGLQLRVLPTEIGQLTQLEELSIRNNQLSMLPKSVIQLKKLETLDCRKNLLSIPPEIFERHSIWQNLEKVQEVLHHYCQYNEI